MVGLLVVAWLALQLFASVLAPFVAAAGIAYVLDPPTTRLTRFGLGRGLAALLMILGLLAGVLLFALLLYPLILQQIGLLLGRIPQYVQLLQRWASAVLTDLQQNFGSDVVNDKLRDLVSSQAGNMLSFIASSLTSVTGAGFAIFNVLTLAVVTPVVGFYLLRDWQRVIAYGQFLAAASLRRCDPRPGPRGGPHPVSLGARPGAVLHHPGALLRLGADRGRPRSRPDRRHRGGTAVVHPLCRLDHRRRHGTGAGDGAVPAMARRHRGGRRAGGAARSWKAT